MKGKFKMTSPAQIENQEVLQEKFYQHYVNTINTKDELISFLINALQKPAQSEPEKLAQIEFAVNNQNQLP